MNNFNGTGVIYLDINDFKQNVLVSKNEKPVTGNWVCMVQGSFCGYCTQAKPAFLEAKKMLGDSVVFCTIQIDGDEAEKALGKNLKKLTGRDMQGVPAFILFKNGKVAGIHKGGRDAKSLARFAQS